MSTESVHGSKAGDDGPVIFSAQDDPFFDLLSASIISIDDELGIQEGTANVTNCWAQGAATSVEAGDNQLSTCATQASADGLSGNALTIWNTNYQALQTQISNTNENYSNVTQGGSTALSNLSQSESQMVQFAQVATSEQDASNSNLMAWGGG